MSNLKNIGNKLFKETTELKSHDVNLGLIQDAESKIKESDALYREVENNVASILKAAANKASAAIAPMSKLRVELFKARREIKEAADKMGFMSSEVKSLINKLSKEIEAQDARADFLNEPLRAIRSKY